MALSLRPLLEEPVSALLANVGKFSNRVGNKLLRMSVNASPWQHAIDTRSGRPVRDVVVERARRQGYVTHREFGLKLAYDESVVSPAIVDRIEAGRYERREARCVREFVVDGDRVIELGAGLGFLSSLIMSTTKIEDYQLIEADPRLAGIIRRTHELNGVDGPATIRTCVATCDPDLMASGETEFHLGAAFCTSSLMRWGNVASTVTVPVISLTDLIEENRSTVLIADIEGGEIGVINGTSLGSIERVLLEIHPHRIRDDGMRQIFRNFSDLGFVYDTAVSAGSVLGFRRAA